jgi:hypothetical protein
MRPNHHAEEPELARAREAVTRREIRLIVLALKNKARCTFRRFRDIYEKKGQGSRLRLVKET